MTTDEITDKLNEFRDALIEHINDSVICDYYLAKCNESDNNFNKHAITVTQYIIKLFDKHFEGLI